MHEGLYLRSLFSPSDLVTMLVLVGVVRLLGDEEDRLDMRGAFGLLLTVGVAMFLVKAAVAGLKAPDYFETIGYFLVWWGVLLFSAKIRPLAATLFVVALVAVKLAAGVAEQRLLRGAIEYASPAQDGVTPAAGKR